jgi:hypothetical protein
MANGSYGDYYTSKGTGSQDVYDEYYDDYGTSTVWGAVNVDTQSNIAGALRGGTSDYITTAESIERSQPRDKSGLPFLILIGIGAYFGGLI